MARTLADATLALAGIFQATWLVNEVAHRGRAPAEPFEAMIGSLFQVDPPDTVSVYGGVARLETGLRLLTEHLGGKPPADGLQIARYVAAVLHLERKLVKNTELMRRLSDGIGRASAQSAHFSITHENVVAALADLYVNTVSTLTPRIIVGGEHGHLSQPANANKVRALLLSAIRSAVLWRQNGGTRLQLLFKRRQFAGEAVRLMASAAD